MLDNFIQAIISAYLKVFKGKDYDRYCFKPYGQSLYFGKQGMGKAVSMADYYIQMRSKSIGGHKNGRS